MSVPPSPWLWPWLVALVVYGLALVAVLVMPWPARRPAARIPGQRRADQDTRPEVLERHSASHRKPGTA